MSNDSPVDTEIAALKWIVEVHESNGALASCSRCRMIWLIVMLASTVFVVVAYKYQLIDVIFLFLGAALAGAAFMAAGMFSQSNASMSVLSQYVDIVSVKKRLDDLQA